MLSNKLAKQPMKQEVYNHLLQAIIQGELEPGKQLDEKEISESLGVSRTPLREAINRLAQEGIVMEIPYRGNFVRKFSTKEVTDLYAVRQTLEVMAIRLAVAHMTTEEADAIADLVHLTAKAEEEGDLASYAKYDTDFHNLIAVFSGNQMLNQMLNSMSTQIKIIRHMANSSEKVVKKAQFDRELILKAIMNRDPEAAGQFMQEHIQHVMEEVIHHLEDTTES